MDGLDRHIRQFTLEVVFQPLDQLATSPRIERSMFPMVPQEGHLPSFKSFTQNRKKSLNNPRQLLRNCFVESQQQYLIIGPPPTPLAQQSALATAWGCLDQQGLPWIHWLPNHLLPLRGLHHPPRQGPEAIRTLQLQGLWRRNQRPVGHGEAGDRGLRRMGSGSKESQRNYGESIDSNHHSSC